MGSKKRQHFGTRLVWAANKFNITLELRDDYVKMENGRFRGKSVLLRFIVLLRVSLRFSLFLCFFSVFSLCFPLFRGERDGNFP